MNFPLYIFFFVYLVFMLAFVIFLCVNLYHIITSASLTNVSFAFTFFTFACTVLVLYFSFTALANVDWKQSVFEQEPNLEFNDTF